MVGLARRAQVEHTEQVKLVQRVRAFYPDVIIAAIPNGGSRTAQERLRLHGEGVLAGMPAERGWVPVLGRQELRRWF